MALLNFLRIAASIVLHLLLINDQKYNYYYASFLDKLYEVFVVLAQLETAAS